MNYAIGRPWNGYDDSSVSFYTYFGQIQSGDMKDAESFRNYVESQTGKKEYIYIVTRLEESKELE